MPNMIDIEMQWCKEFVESLNGRAPSAAELYDFLDIHIKRVEDAHDDGYAKGFADAKFEYDDGGLTNG
jgi:hypothetical protein